MAAAAAAAVVWLVVLSRSFDCVALIIAKIATMIGYSGKQCVMQSGGVIYSSPDRDRLETGSE